MRLLIKLKRSISVQIMRHPCFTFVHVTVLLFLLSNDICNLINIIRRDYKYIRHQNVEKTKFLVMLKEKLALKLRIRTIKVFSTYRASEKKTVQKSRESTVKSNQAHFLVQ